MPQATQAHHTYSYENEKDMLLARLRKIEGQARGIARMVEEDRYCLDVIQQISALTSAADEVALLILQSHIQCCVADAIREQRGGQAIEELMEAIRKAVRR